MILQLIIISTKFCLRRFVPYICSKCGFGIIISEGILDYAFNVMLLVQLDGRRVVIVSSWGDV